MKSGIRFKFIVRGTVENIGNLQHVIRAYSKAEAEDRYRRAHGRKCLLIVETHQAREALL